MRICEDINMSSDANLTLCQPTPRNNVKLELKQLKAPQEGRTKKDCEDFVEKIDNHVSVHWTFGQDVSHVLKNTALPTFEEPEDLDDKDEKIK